MKNIFILMIVFVLILSSCRAHIPQPIDFIREMSPISFGDGSGLKDTLLDWYDTILSFVGRAALTNKLFLIGEREFGDDCYTGRYSAACAGVSGTDVVFGGVSINPRRIRLSVSTTFLGGSAELIIKSGTDVETYDLGGLRLSELEVRLESGSSIAVRYESFRGSVTLKAEYV